MAKTAMLLAALAVAGLTAAPLAQAAGPASNDPNFGMPRDVASAARDRCSKLTSYYSSQSLCMQWEAQGYAKMNPAQASAAVAYDIETETAKAKARASDKEPGRLAVCPPPHRMTEKDGCR
jgi:hypothetical protein